MCKEIMKHTGASEPVILVLEPEWSGQNFDLTTSQKSRGT